MRLKTVTAWGENQLYSYDYDKGSQLDRIAWPNGVVSDYGYDDGGRLTVLTHQQGKTVLADYAYTFDALGNRTQAVETLLTPTIGEA